MMPTAHETDVVPAPLAARLFFDNATLSDTALKLERLIENAGSNSSPYLEALGTVLAHELVRLNAGALRFEGPVRGGLAARPHRTATPYIPHTLAQQTPLRAR